MCMKPSRRKAVNIAVTPVIGFAGSDGPKPSEPFYFT